jgi:hypothetical protein
MLKLVDALQFWLKSTDSNEHMKTHAFLGAKMTWWGIPRRGELPVSCEAAWVNPPCWHYHPHRRRAPLRRISHWPQRTEVAAAIHRDQKGNKSFHLLSRPFQCTVKTILTFYIYLVEMSTGWVSGYYNRAFSSFLSVVHHITFTSLFPL